MSPKKLSLNIFLVGFMGAGKSAVGKALSARLGMDFVELDEDAEREEGISISEIFAGRGEEYFRELESKVLSSRSKGRSQVISTGGGAVLSESNREVMKKHGVTIYLKATADVLWERVKHNTNRPLLQVDKPLERLRELLGSREVFYEQADIVVDTEGLSPERVAEEIIRRLDDV